MKTVTVSVRSGPRVREALAAFGVRLRRGSGGPECAAAADRAAAILLRRLDPGRVALIEGPSGSGKTLLLRALARRLGRRRLAPRPLSPGEHRRPVIDLVGDSTARALALLSRAGLADAAILPRTPGELSDGQRWRLELARLLERAERRRDPWLLIDEYAGPLDGPTAMGVSRTLSRWARLTGARVVAATVRAEVERALQPQLVVRADLGGCLDGVHDRTGEMPNRTAPAHRTRWT